MNLNLLCKSFRQHIDLLALAHLTHTIARSDDPTDPPAQVESSDQDHAVPKGGDQAAEDKTPKEETPADEESDQAKTKDKDKEKAVAKDTDQSEKKDDDDDDEDAESLFDKYRRDMVDDVAEINSGQDDGKLPMILTNKYKFISRADPVLLKTKPEDRNYSDKLTEEIEQEITQKDTELDNLVTETDQIKKSLDELAGMLATLLLKNMEEIKKSDQKQSMLATEKEVK